MSRGSQGRSHVDGDARVAAGMDWFGLRRTAWVLIALVAIFVIVWRWPLDNPLAGASRYAPVHIALETASIVMALLVFAITWNSFRSERPRNILILGCALGAAGLIDFVHMLSFPGMPDFVTPSGTEKAINFWLAARALVAAALLAAAVLPWRPLADARWRWVIAGGSFGIAALVIWTGLFHHDIWPRTFLPDTGLTPFKIGAEYVIVAMFAAAGLVFLGRALQTRGYVETRLFAVAAVSVLSELAFTLYSDMTDIFSLTGHVFHVIAVGYLYRAIFVSSVRQPFERAIAAEADTRRLSRRLERLLANLPTGVVVHRADSTISYANPEALSILGLTEDQALGRTVLDPAWHFIRDDGSVLPVAEYPASRVIAEGGSLTGMTVGAVPTVGADTRWGIVHAFAEADDGDHPREIIVSFVDITERKHAEDALRRLNRELRAISLCSEALVRADNEQGLLASICQIVCETAGYKMAWVGYAVQDQARTVRPVASGGVVDGYLDAARITWADAPRGRGPTGTAVREGVVTAIQDFAVDTHASPWRDEALRRGYRSVIGLPLKDERGIPFGALSIYSADAGVFTPNETRLLEELSADLAFGIGVLRARTTHDELESQLRQAQKMEVVGQLAGGIAHDFNNLLAAIRGYGELLRSELPESDELGRGDLDEILAAAARAELLTRQLLAFARRQVLVPVEIRPADIAVRFAPMLRRVLGEQVELITSADGATGLVRVDPGQLEQVILNLAVNARDAMPGGGRLEIAVADTDVGRNGGPGPLAQVATGPYVSISVADSGTGMDEATLEHLFEPFFTTKAEGRGTGLGLATVYGIVRQSGGYIVVESELGQGSVFRILLPRLPADAGPEPAAAAIGRAPRRGTETVLLVEDDPAVRRYAARVLEGLGYAVLEAAAGADALGLVSTRAGVVDLLVTDIAMPGMQGPELARRLRELRPAIRVLFMSAYPGGAVVDDGPFAGQTALPKPFSIDTFSRAVRAALDAAAEPAG
jgi:PAS domain S-box-containing protein